ncbi:Post-GPI attachment to proteins factor 3, variant 2 [Clonorchis sinensis]|uniref:Post-GPI attachment to proteins factor 3 n=1 Tax=Clonorchis sinensis TaxID=79923 RepID=A0A8T1MB95_CLOSI|nr:Post-GPI attachment to proteins factor 3, variant 2 [Clonorchis sinensis]
MRAVAVMLTLCLSCMSPGLASSGDRSYVFFMCNRRCLSSLCNRSDNAGPPDWNKVHPVDMLEDTIHWHCPRECGYRCMWKTVEAFVSDGLPTPQFYGKWPFLRLLGIQEPASALLSALNLLIQFRYLALLCLQFDNRLPMFKYWIAQYLGSINAWLWSTVFHTCDVPFTEKMDYFSATAFVMASIITLQRRVFPKHPLLNYALPFIVMGIFLRYVNYMLVREFNYTYNMMFGVTFGLINCCGWLLWSLFCDRKQQAYVLNCRVSILCLMISMSLELWDFPPIGWFLDAHALWHASSIVVAVTWYRFVRADCLFQQHQKKAF